LCKKKKYIYTDTLKKNTGGHPLQLKNREGEQEKEKTRTITASLAVATTERSREGREERR